MAENFIDAELEYYLEELRGKTQNGLTLEAAADKMRRHPHGAPPEEILKEAMDIFRHQTDLIVEYDTAESVVREHSTGNWYDGPQPNDIYWPHLKKGIEAKIGDAVIGVDEASSQVVASLRPSGDSDFDTRGLVLGYVQSGKTTNFLSVMAKAADVGYRFFIVLTGITESLRSQTQERLDSQLVNGTPNWIKLTTRDNDFKDTQETNRENAASYLSNNQNRVIAVVKKNVAVLRKLNHFIKSAGVHADNCPILIIDDEADQASISVSKDPDTNPSAINEQIRILLDNNKAAYVAYTATPFANILVNPNTHQDIYPRDFIHVLPKPEGYFGTEMIFGVSSPHGEDFEESDGLNMIRRVEEEESDALRPPTKKHGKEEEWDPYIPESLTQAVRWFIIASADRRARGAYAHSSMLIHTAMRTNAHEKTKELLEPEIHRLRQEFLNKPEIWEEQWFTESETVRAEEFDNPKHSFEELSVHIPQVIEELKLIVDNSRSDERLEYNSDEPATVIVIGANTLSRGLTLEGLICSYFVRNATAYDTLLQMGRWFGFRFGYQDLPRIWLTEDLEHWFQALSLVELDLRQDFSRYAREGISPMDFLPRIRLTPGIEVTNRAKQQSMVKAHVSFSGQRVQTILFNHRDKDWLKHNIDATKGLVEELKVRQLPQINKSNGTVVFRQVPNESILDFLKKYKIQENALLGDQGSKALIDYIRKEQESGSIREWSVSFFGKSVKEDASESKTIDLGLDKEISLIMRSQMFNSRQGVANIKTLVGSLDRLNDVDLNKSEWESINERIKADKGRSREAVLIAEHASFIGADVGHIAIYAIDKDSTTSQKADSKSPKAHQQRKNLNAEEHVIGVGIFFPESNRPEGSVEYVSVIAPDEETRERIKDAKEEDLHVKS
ncbi:Z1 domain-containing protein [Corynebacterium casei]|uniref:Z1 domain-containing protein n=1 Tax=Corynebacterium casei TaxID=160386 RepID=UPI003F956793